MSVAIAVHVHRETVHREMTSGRFDFTVNAARHFVPHRLRIVRCRPSLHRRSQGDRSAKTNLTGGGTHLCGHQVAEGAWSFRRSPTGLGFEALMDAANSALLIPAAPPASEALLPMAQPNQRHVAELRSRLLRVAHDHFDEPIRPSLRPT